MRIASPNSRTTGAAEPQPKGQAYEALDNLIRYEHDSSLLAIYRRWLSDLWEVGWHDENPIFTYVTLAACARSDAGRPDFGKVGSDPARCRATRCRGARRGRPNADRLPVDRVVHPVMNSIRKDVQIIPTEIARGTCKPSHRCRSTSGPSITNMPGRGNPCELDGWLKPTLSGMQFSCDDPQVAWFCDSAGGAYETLDHGKSWQSVTRGLMGRATLIASKERTFVVWADCGNGLFVTRDGGLSWRPAAAVDATSVSKTRFYKMARCHGFHFGADHQKADSSDQTTAARRMHRP